MAAILVCLTEYLKSKAHITAPTLSNKNMAAIWYHPNFLPHQSKSEFGVWSRHGGLVWSFALREGSGFSFDPGSGHMVLSALEGFRLETQTNGFDRKGLRTLCLMSNMVQKVAMYSFWPCILWEFKVNL